MRPDKSLVVLSLLEPAELPSLTSPQTGAVDLAGGWIGALCFFLIFELFAEAASLASFFFSALF